MAATRAQRLLALFTLGLSLAACSAGDDGLEDDETASDESELGSTSSGALQVYNMNTHQMSEPGKPSFVRTDFRQLVAYMHEQKYLPDVITLSEVGRTHDVDGTTSQPCTRFLKELRDVVRGKTNWDCVVAHGKVDGLNNTRGGSAIIFRTRLQPLQKTVLTNYVWEDGKGCVVDKGNPNETLIQTFRDGTRTVAVASLHLIGSSDKEEGTAPATAAGCADKNLNMIARTLNATKADVSIIGGDMNHYDAVRTVDASGAVTHHHWEKEYAGINGYLKSPNAGFKDAWFKDCAVKCGVKSPDDKTNYTDARSQCISACIAGKTSVNRMDWLLVGGARSLSDNVSISFAAARASYVQISGDQNAVAQYSDHPAQRLLVKY